MRTGRHVGRLSFAVALALILTGILKAQFATPAPSPIVDANTRFAFKLFKQLNTKTPDRNLLVAPTGLSLTFGLLDNGSDPETRREIESAFEFTGMELAQVNEGFAALRKELYIVPRPSKKKMPNRAKPGLDGRNPNGIVVADSLWIRNTSFTSPFLKTSQRYYGVDLKRWLPPPNASTQISQWASQRVDRKVPLSIDTMDRHDFLLVDVTRFHSFWRDKFDVSRTKPAPFTLLSGQKKSVSMMHDVGYFTYFATDKFQAVALHYSENASMYVFLPAEDSSLKELEQTLTANNWQEWLSQFDSHEGLVGLPRFKTETGFDVRDALKSLGVERIFKNFAALQPAVTMSEGARLTKALQKTELGVDEEGTEAISVDLMGGVPGGIAGGVIGQERPKPFVMVVNRPFFFAIRHNPTGQLLFLGAVVEP